jgi:hypothetical protein
VCFRIETRETAESLRQAPESGPGLPPAAVLLPNPMDVNTAVEAAGTQRREGHRVLKKSTTRRTFPQRAKWLAHELHVRSLNEHGIEGRRGPDHKTVKKILDGLYVQPRVLPKLARALSFSGKKVSVEDIPNE